MSNDVFLTYQSRLLLWLNGLFWKEVSELHHGFRKAVERIINQGFFLSPLLNAKYDYDDGVVKGLLHNKYWVTKT